MWIQLIFLTIVLAIWAGINGYIGWRGWQAFGHFLPPVYSKIYWALFILLVASYLLGRLGGKYLPQWLSSGLSWLGSYWLAFFFYAFLALLFIDLVRLLDYWLGFIPTAVRQSPAVVGLFVVGLLVLILAYGSWKAWHPVFQPYDITIPKTERQEQLHVIMISDIHFGNVVNGRRLAGLIEQINQREPDLVLLVGDVVDEDSGILIEQELSPILRQLKPKMGTYAVLGNHEYYSGNIDDFTIKMQADGVTVLRDQYQLVSNAFYLVGRDDPGQGRQSRRSLAHIMTGINHELPIIMMDHRPVDFEEARVNGVDLQLSGHTHLGQLYPNNLITKRIYEVDWGYLRKGNLQVIVSCGLGTWGPPIRVGNTPEVVEILIKFQQ